MMMILQMQRVTKDKCLDIINKFEPSKEGRRRCQLGIDGEWIHNVWEKEGTG